MHCCYLLTPERGGGEKTYVGYTTDPTRRIRQHNGELTMGAKRTRWHRPWRFVCVVMGLPSRFSGLSFEWAWQNPFKGRLTKDQMAPYAKVKGFGRRFDVRRKLIELKVMLSVCKPFKDLALTVCFARQEDWVFFENVLGPESPIPRHIVVEAREIGECYRELKRQAQGGDFSITSLVTTPEAFVCLLCEAAFVCGLPAMHHAECGLLAHPVCLAREFLRSQGLSKGTGPNGSAQDPVLRPRSGACPLCDVELAWAELVRDASLVAQTAEALDGGDQETAKDTQTPQAGQADDAGDARAD